MPMVVDYFEVTPGYRMEKRTAIAGRTLGEFDLHGRSGVLPIILRNGDKVMVSPQSDEMIIVGLDARLEKVRA